MIVVLGELGGRDEYSLVEALQQGSTEASGSMGQLYLCTPLQV
jgi:hypothetical protein